LNGHSGFLGTISLALLVTGCSTAHSDTPVRSATPLRYYVSIGDSYSVGYQPSPTPGATAGYTAYVAQKENLKLESFGCSGATTASILHTNGCTAPYGPGAATDSVPYASMSQAVAAEAFIRAHKGSIGLVTVSIGGNDITSCVTAANPVSCVITALGTIKANVTVLARGLRSAAGAGVPIIGLTYPDVFLGLWVYPPGKTDRDLATLSVTAFQSLFNPALKTAYTGAGGTFLDITAATGAYTALTNLTTFAPYGTIPKAVAEVCMLTWYCSQGHIHANTAGYTFIGQQIATEYAKVSHS